MTEPVHWSLGFFKAKGYQILVTCPSGHSFDADLGKAIDLLGPDLKFPEGRDRFLAAWRCRTCRAHGTSMIITAPSGY